jgi:FkbM family methyltransferase
VVDVGANIGYFSLACAALGARVIVFEPMLRNVRKLSKSVYRNHFLDRLTVYQNAAWDAGP